MINPKVSIIIPVYNVDPYLRQCLGSIISQTFENIEIIIINDCSTDNSYQIIQEYQEKDKRIITINLEKNTGLGNTRNTGLKHSTGKYIVFIDSDDWVEKNYIETLCNSIEKNNCDFVIATHYTYDNSTKKLKSFKQKEFFYKNEVDSIAKKQKLITLRMIWSVWNKIYKRDFLTANNISFKTNRMEDNLFIYNVILKASKIILIKNAIYYYRINRKNSIMDNRTDRIYDCIEIAAMIKKLLVSNNVFEIYSKSFYPYLALMFAAELEVSNLYLAELKKISEVLKHVFFEDMKIPFYKTYDKCIYKIRLFCFYSCLKYGINYAILGRILRKFYNLFH
ncbi:MAG: glycosyltransferase family 2 protein [Endomicrobiaceae bacterium]|nr:glycosyltransferase family 2 protein [Endomicrobiaceae bacterium]